jgi:hypothetical protein
MNKVIPFLAAVAVGAMASALAQRPASATAGVRVHDASFAPMEWISLVNTGPDPVRLDGYAIRDRSGHAYRFGHLTIAGDGGRVFLRTGPGRDAGRVVYWGRADPVWDKTGDTATLLDPAGNPIDTCVWANARYAHC